MDPAFIAYRTADTSRYGRGVDVGGKIDRIVAVGATPGALPCGFGLMTMGVIVGATPPGCGICGIV